MLFRASLLDALASEPQRRLLRLMLAEKYKPMTGRDLVRVSRVPSGQRYLHQLKDLGLVSPERVGKALVWKVDSEGWAYAELRRVLRLLEATALEALKETLRKNLAVEGVERVVLFGSIAEGRERPGSDIDTFILVKDEGSRIPVQEAVERARVACLHKFGNSLSAFVLTRSELQKKANLPVVESVKKGIPVLGRA